MQTGKTHFPSAFETKIKDMSGSKLPELDNKLDKSVLLKQKYVPRQREPNEPDIRFNSQCLKSITGFETLHQLPPYVSKRETTNPMIERFKSPLKKKDPNFDDESMNFGSTKKTFGIGAITHTTISRPPTTTIINLRKKTEQEKKGGDDGRRNFTEQAE